MMFGEAGILTTKAGETLKAWRVSLAEFPQQLHAPPLSTLAGAFSTPFHSLLAALLSLPVRRRGES